MVNLESISVTEILCILILYEHLGETDSIRRSHIFLTEKTDVSRLVKVLDVVICSGKHTA